MTEPLKKKLAGKTKRQYKSNMYFGSRFGFWKILGKFLGGMDQDN